MDIKVGLTINVLNFVDPRFQFPILEDGRGTAGRAWAHDGRLGWARSLGNASREHDVKRYETRRVKRTIGETNQYGCKG